MPTWREQLIEAAKSREAAWFLERAEKIPSVVGLTGIIGKMLISPVKSFGALVTKKAWIGCNGLQLTPTAFVDRAAMIVRRQSGMVGDQPHEFIRYSQRNLGQLVLAKPRVSSDTVVYAARGMAQDLAISPEMLKPRDGDVVTVRMSLQTDELVYGVLENGYITSWVRDLISQHDSEIDTDDIHVLVPHLTFNRGVDTMHSCGHDARTQYSDGGNVTIVSSKTWADMETTRAAECDGGVRPISIDCYRMNVRLQGLPSCAEYFIGSISIKTPDGPIPLDFGGSCIRCGVPGVKLDDGSKPDKAPLDWLLANLPPRPDKLKSATFGINCVIPQKFAGRCLVTDMPFEVLSEKE